MNDHVFIIAVGTPAAEEQDTPIQGDYYRRVVYTSEARAYEDVYECLDDFGGDFNEQTPDPDDDHVVRQWGSDNHTVWLERLEVE